MHQCVTRVSMKGMKYEEQSPKNGTLGKQSRKKGIDKVRLFVWILCGHLIRRCSPVPNCGGIPPLYRLPTARLGRLRFLATTFGADSRLTVGCSAPRTLHIRRLVIPSQGQSAYPSQPRWWCNADLLYLFSRWILHPFILSMPCSAHQGPCASLSFRLSFLLLISLRL